MSNLNLNIEPSAHWRDPLYYAPITDVDDVLAQIEEQLRAQIEADPHLLAEAVNEYLASVDEAENHKFGAAVAAVLRRDPAPMAAFTYKAVRWYAAHLARARLEAMQNDEDDFSDLRADR